MEMNGGEVTRRVVITLAGVDQGSNAIAGAKRAAIGGGGRGGSNCHGKSRAERVSRGAMRWEGCGGKRPGRGLRGVIWRVGESSADNASTFPLILLVR